MLTGFFRNIFFLSLLALLITADGGRALAQNQDQDAAKIEIRNTLTDEYNRIIFFGDVGNRFDVSFLDNVITLNFAKPIETSFEGLLLDMREYFLSAGLSPDKKSVILRLKDGDINIRKFTGDQYAGIDILAKAPEKPIVLTETAQKPAVEDIKENAEDKEIIKQTPPKLEEIVEIVSPVPNAKPVSILPPKVAVVGSARGNPALAVNPVIRPQELSIAPAELAEKVEEKPVAKPIAEKPPAPVQEKKADKKIAEEKAEGEIAKKDDEVITDTLSRSGTPKDPTALVTKVQALKNGSRIIFPWRNLTAAAIFTRAGYSWVIFNKPTIADLKPLNASTIITNPEQISDKYYTIIRFRHIDDGTERFVSAYRKDFDWVLEITPEKKPPARPVEISAKALEKDSQVLVDILKTAEKFDIADPEVGDKLTVIPAYNSGSGVSPARNFVDFSLPETHQGVIVKILSDDTTASMIKTGVRITSDRGLNLYEAKNKIPQVKPGKVKAFQKETFLPFDGSEYYVRLAEEKKKNGEEEGILDFQAVKQYLYRELINAKKEERTEKRLEIAKFYFSEAVYKEALGMLKEARLEDLTLNNSKEFLRLYAATSFLAGRYKEAEKIFGELQGELTVNTGMDEVLLLRWASNHLIRPKSQQFKGNKYPFNYYRNFDGFIRQYPSALRHRLGLMVAEERIRQENYEMAENIIDLLSSDPASDFYKNWASFLSGRLLDINKEYENAIDIYTALTEKIDDRLNRARAGAALNSLLLKTGQIKPAEALEKLELLRTVWRGDDFEMELLNFVAQLYINEKEYLKGLRAWRDLVTQFPRTEEALYTAGRMKKTFVDLFNEGAAYKIPPFVALALYFEFRELTPVGSLGDKIIRQLVDHFIETDLLENAAALLTHQVRFRSRGNQQAVLAFKLASIHLQNRRPDLTLKVLNFIDNDSVSPDVLQKRTYLRARAKIMAEDYFGALENIVDDFSSDAEDIRLDIFRKQKNWPAIIDIIEPRLQAIADSRYHMTQRETRDVMMIALAYANQEKNRKLEALGNMFEKKLPDGNTKDIFRYITADVEMVDPARLGESIQLENVKLFMTREFFWPGKEWVNIISSLAPVVNNFDENKLSPEQKKQVIQLSVAYNMHDSKDAQKGWRDLSRKFSKMMLSKADAAIFQELQRIENPITADIFETPLPLNELPTLITEYESVFKEPELEEPTTAEEENKEQELATNGEAAQS